MSEEIVRLAREAATEARDSFEQDWIDAEETGDRPDLIRIETEIPVEWIEHMADRIEELEAALSSSEIEHGLTSNGNLWRFWSDKANSIAEKNTTLGQKIEELEAKLQEFQKSQSYSYIGRDMKTVLARDLEDRAETAEAKLAKAVEALKEIAACDEYFHDDGGSWRSTEEALIARAVLAEINGGGDE